MVKSVVITSRGERLNMDELAMKSTSKPSAKSTRESIGWVADKTFKPKIRGFVPTGGGTASVQQAPLGDLPAAVQPETVVPERTIADSTRITVKQTAAMKNARKSREAAQMEEDDEILGDITSQMD